MGQENRKAPDPLLDALSRYVIPAIYKEVVQSESGTDHISATQSLSMAKACLSQDAKACSSMALAWYQLGISLDCIYAEGVTAAAAHLGEWWLEDRITFVEVTLAAERLQDLVLNGHALFASVTPADTSAKSYVALLGKPVPCQHTLGLLVVGEVFRRRGWQVLKCERSSDELLDTLENTFVDLLGLSVAHSDQVVKTQLLIQQCKAQSKNPGLIVMVGGPQAFARPDLSQELGAHFSSTNAREGEMCAKAQVEDVRRRQCSNQDSFTGVASSH